MGCNLIKRAHGLQGLAALVHLELNNNLLYMLDDVSELALHAPGLRVLDLRGNALCEAKSYTHTALRLLPQLTMLDGQEVTPASRAEARTHEEAITAHVLRAQATGARRAALAPAASSSASAAAAAPGGSPTAHPHHHAFVVEDEEPALRARYHDRTGTFALQLRPGGLASELYTGGARAAGVAKPAASGAAAGGSKGAAAAAGGGGVARGGVGGGDDGEDADGALWSGAAEEGGEWWLRIEHLELGHRRLRRIQNLARLSRLRKLVLADNEVRCAARGRP